MTSARLYLTFGPVQEFLAQARRTRDLWAGSYLLSFLAGHALKAAVTAGGTVVLPSLDGNPLSAAIKSGGVPVPPGDRVGSIPHVAEITVPEGRAEEVARAAVNGWNERWQRIAVTVREHAVRVCPTWTRETEEIWRRQVDHLWTASWVLDGHAFLARRKTLRAFTLPDEPGETCTCCGLREPLHAGNPSRGAVRAFWEHVARRTGPVEVRPGGEERLCAVCAVKRFLPHVAVKALGWPVPSGFPSTSTMAGLPWRLDVLKCGAADPALRTAVGALVDALRAAGASESRELEDVAGVRELVEAWGAGRETARTFSRVAADWLNADDARRRAKDEGRESALPSILPALRDLRAVAERAGVPSPRTSFALLAMDGDNMGALLAKHQQQKPRISTALGAFSARAREIVESAETHGRLIYAGGDDVLALLPVETALETARRLRQAYMQTFRDALPEAFSADPKPSISAGIVYAHAQTPLRQVVHTAHTLLDGVAKERPGKDSFAVAVWKRSGKTLEFAAKWDAPADGGEPAAVARIEAVSTVIANREFSRGYLYGLQDLLEVMRGLGDGVELEVLAAEYLKSRERKVDIDTARARVQTLLHLSPDAGDRYQAVRLALFLAGEE